jgi:precorrin-2 dehydrogenase/sirohydrochlorin ferrochelatase
LPILVEGTALRVLVVGGGTVASRKTAAMLEAGARVRVVAPAVSDAMRAIADAGRVELIERRYERGDIDDAQLVVAATDDRHVNAAITEDARNSNRLVNVADAPTEGSFATMATLRHGALVIGVSAAGVPGAAARIRDAIAARFDSRYARALADLRTLRRELLDRGEGATWRACASEVIDDGFCDVVERGVLGERMAAWR